MRRFHSSAGSSRHQGFFSPGNHDPLLEIRQGWSPVDIIIIVIIIIIMPPIGIMGNNNNEDMRIQLLQIVTNLLKGDISKLSTYY
jgi:hypothetical protein